jgi:hypothetical protein
MDPGVDRHEWESELASLEDELRDSPREALPELADLVERMLLARGFSPDLPEREGDEPELLATYRAARDVATRVELEADDVGPGDVGQAIVDLRGLFDYLVEERAAP